MEKRDFESSAAVDMPERASQIGRTLDDRYRIEGEVGSGGIGAVYRATHLKLGQQVAIKILHEHYGVHPALRKRFEREAKALASLAHPNIVSVTDYGVSADTPYLVMELLEGETLSDRLARGALAPNVAFEITRHLLRALSFVHERGLVHRDLKPGNVFLQRLPGGEERPKLLDFGLAKFLEHDPTVTGQTVTRAGDVVGTPAYMSPEQVAGDAADARSDVYAMGVLIFQMLCGRTPFQGEAAELLRSHLTEAVPALAALQPNYEPQPELEAVLQRAMAKRRQERHQDGAELLRALEAIPTPWLRARGAGDDPVHNTLAIAPTMLDAGRPAPQALAAQPELSAATPTVAGPSLIGRLLGWLGKLLRGVLMAGARVLTIVSLGVIVLAGGVIYVMTNPARKQERAALEQLGERVAPHLPQLAAAAQQIKRDGSDAVQQVTAAPPAAVAAADPVNDPVNVGSPPSAADEPSAAPLPHSTTPRPAAKNPWLRGVPKDLRTLRKAILAGEYGSERAVTILRDYDAAHLDDVRGHLLLARLYVNRHWRADAVNQYTIAYQIDRSCRGAPHMLSDLIEIVTQGTAADKAARLVREAYRREALAALDRAVHSSHNDAQAQARLTALRSRIAAD